MPAPAALPILTPTLNPSGFIVLRRTSMVRRKARMSNVVCSSSSTSRPGTWATGATIVWPGLYGNLFNITSAPSGRHTASSASLSLGSVITRQNRQPGRCSPAMYSMRHGAHSRFIDLRPFLALGHGGLGLDLRPGQRRAHTLPDPALSPTQVRPRLPGHGGAGAAIADAPGGARGNHRGRRPRRRLSDPD